MKTKFDHTRSAISNCGGSELNDSQDQQGEQQDRYTTHVGTHSLIKSYSKTSI